MTSLQVLPYGVEMATTEKIPFGFDATKLLVGAQTPANAVSVLTDMTTATNIPLGADTPEILANIITQEIKGTLLEVNHIYELAISFDADGQTTFTMVQKISCVR